MERVDYVIEWYRQCLRDLIKDIAKVQANSSGSENTIELEMEHIQKTLEKERVDFLFKSILNEKNYCQWLLDQTLDINEYRRRHRGFAIDEIDFSSIRNNIKDNNENEGSRENENDKEIEKSIEQSKDIVWTLYRSGVRLAKDELIEEDKFSYKQFELLLQQIGFSDEEKQIFCHSDKEFWFNGLTDNGDTIYGLLHQEVLVHDGGRMLVHSHEKDTYLFSKALEGNKKDTMYDKLKKMLRLCYKTQKSESIQKMDAETAIKVAACLSDLIPIIDKNSKLKSEEQLQEERIVVRLAVIKKFMMQVKNDARKSEDGHLKNILKKYFEDYTLVKMLLEEVYNIGKFNEDQILLMTEGYLNMLDQSMKLFQQKVMQYQKECEKLKDKSIPSHMYRDIWESILNSRGENK